MTGVSYLVYGPPSIHCRVLWGSGVCASPPWHGLPGSVDFGNLASLSHEQRRAEELKEKKPLTQCRGEVCVQLIERPRYRAMGSTLDLFLAGR